jgi:hypothetical protein
MNITALYPFIRSLVGDRQVMGAWHYRNDDIASAVRTAFVTGRAPIQYHLVGDLQTAMEIAPDLATGDDMAIVLYEAALILIGGEDGRKSIKTRELTLTDGGDRKRDLLHELKLQVYRIRSGDTVFSTSQTLTQFFGAGEVKWSDLMGMSARPLGNLSI